MLFCTPCWKEKQPSRALKNTMAQMCPCSSVKNSLTHAAKYMLICRILHGWIPDNTDENLDWIKLLDLMKTNYLGDSQVYRKATHKNTASDNFPLIFPLIFNLLLSFCVIETMYPETASLREYFPKSKGERSGPMCHVTKCIKLCVSRL